MDYLAKSVGADFEAEATIMVDNEGHTVGSDGKITLDKTAAAFTSCTEIYAYVKKIYDGATSKAIADADFVTYPVNSNNEIADATGAAVTFTTDDKYCVKYFTDTAAAKSIKVSSNYIPATFHIVLKVNLYAAGQSDANKTKVGYLLIDIPRFQLDGSQDLSMSMTGASTTSLKGSALATEGCADASCDADNYYAILTEVMDEANWYDGLKFLAVEGGDIDAKKNSTFNPLDYIYAVFDGTAPKKLSTIPSDQLFYAVLSADAKLTVSDKMVTAAGNAGDVGTLNIGIYESAEKAAMATTALSGEGYAPIFTVPGVDVNIISAAG